MVELGHDCSGDRGEVGGSGSPGAKQPAPALQRVKAGQESPWGELPPKAASGRPSPPPPQGLDGRIGLVPPGLSEAPGLR